MTREQYDTIGAVLSQVDFAGIPRTRVEVSDGEWHEDDGFIEVTIWTLGSGVTLAIEPGGALCDPTDANPMRLVIGEHPHIPGERRFAVEPVEGGRP